jgi:hypothetical protein
MRDEGTLEAVSVRVGSVAMLKVEGERSVSEGIEGPTGDEASGGGD